jgi:ABC-type molybdenum transport system ATPase subunit/photorepair protein PhrA
VLDEPTTGLHMHEVGMLVQVLHRLGITAPLLCSSNTIWMSWPPRTTY